MNRKEAERLSEKWCNEHGIMRGFDDRTDANRDEQEKSLASLLLRTYKKGVKDGIVLGAVAVTPITKGRKHEAR